MNQPEMRVLPDKTPAASRLQFFKFAWLLIASLALGTACKDQNAPSPAAGAGSGGGGGSGAAGKGFAGAGAAPAVSVIASTVKAEQWGEELLALGTANARESITLSAKVTETVARINFQDGETVRAGDVLVELTGKAEVAALKEAQASFVESERQFQRLSTVVKQGTVTQAALDQQSALRDQSLARREAIRARLSDRVITAPFSGVTGFRMVSPGALVTPGTAITTLDDISQLKIDFMVPENQLGSMQTGAEVLASSDAYPEQRFVGEIRSIDSRIDPASRAVKVRAVIDNPEGVLKPGMLLQIRAQLRPRAAVVVHELAVLQLGSESFVYRVKADSTVEKVSVKLGLRKAGWVEASNLKVGDQVVSEGSMKMREGALVKVLSAAAAASVAN